VSTDRARLEWELKGFGWTKFLERRGILLFLYTTDRFHLYTKIGYFMNDDLVGICLGTAGTIQMNPHYLIKIKILVKEKSSVL
jgi:hypothetical protein